MKVKTCKVMLNLKKGIIISALIACISTTLPQDDTYNEIKRVGKNSFVVAGNTHLHLYDESLNYLNNVPRKTTSGEVQLTTIYPLNYTIVHYLDDNSLSLIKWDGAYSALVFDDLEIDDNDDVSTVTCLDDSTLCFVSYRNGDFIRFDIRQLEDPPFQSEYFLKINSDNPYSALVITDSNLNYMFGLVGDILHFIDPKTLVSQRHLNTNLTPDSPKCLTTFMSSPLVIVTSLRNAGTSETALFIIDIINQKSYRVDQHNNFVDITGSPISTTTIYDGVIPIRGTRYIAQYSNSDTFSLKWFNYDHKFDINIQSKILTPSININSLAYSRIDDNNILFVGVSSLNGPKQISRINVSTNSLSHIKDGGYLAFVQNACATNQIYLKDRCYSCRPGSVLVYTSNGETEFTTDCLQFDTTISKNYFNAREFNPVNTCYNDINLCKGCLFMSECTPCFPPLVKINGFCTINEKDCLLYNADGSRCLSCNMDKPYLQDGNCQTSCTGLVSYQIHQSLNICNLENPIDECPSGQIVVKDNSGNDVCRQCPSGFVRSENICLVSCPYGNIKVGGSCVSCPPGMKATKLDTCVSETGCQTEEILLKNSCVKNCANGNILQNYECIAGSECGDYYYKGGSHCYPQICDPNNRVFTTTGCQETCPADQIVDEFKYCRSCPVGEYKKENECVVNCGDNFFINGNVCSPCFGTCKTCSGSLNTQCISCHNDKPEKYLDGNQCLSDCGVRKFADILDYCMDCHSSCLKCSNNLQNACTECDITVNAHKYLNQNECIGPNCPANFFGNDATKTCDPCHSSCLTCSAGGLSDCLSCNPAGPNKYFKNNECLTSCLTTEYSDGNNHCLLCDLSCLTCNGNLPTNCQSCNPSNTSHKLLKNNECVHTCGDNFFDDGNNHCLPCDPSCLTCSGPSLNQCLSCDPNTAGAELLWNNECIQGCGEGEFKDPADDACKFCSATCLNCSEFGTDKCASCNQATGLKYLKNGECLNSCGSQFYPHSPSNNCQPCHSNCLTCNGPNSNQCLTCKNTGLFLHLRNNQCLENCPEGEYSDSNKSCQVCDSDCLTCDESGPSRCLTCKQDEAKKYLKGQECLTICPDGDYPDVNKKCQNCSSDCKECIGPSPSECSSCKTGPTDPQYYQGTSCQSSCDIGFYPGNSKICQACHSSCKSCDGPTETSCLSCTNIGNQNHLLEERKCVSGCSPGYSESNFNCLACNIGCKTCSGLTASDCDSCHVPKILNHDKSCVDFCSPPYTEINSVCVESSDPQVIYESQCINNCPLGTIITANRECQFCPDGQVLFEQTCIDKYPVGNEADLSIKYCKDCKKNQENKKIWKEEKCVEECGEDYFINTDNICEQCQPPLVVSKGECLPCKDGMEYNQERGNCTEIIISPDNKIKILDKSCFSCHRKY